MHEHSLEAIVLEREEAGESDSRLTLYTHELGKIRARATSLRKITSKLSSHLQPGDLSRVRIVSRNDDGRTYRIADAVRIKRVEAPPAFLLFIKELTPESEPDELLWDLLCSGKDDKRRALQIMGWDPAHAKCGYCAMEAVRFFSEASQLFSCITCSSRFLRNEVLYEIG